MIKYTVVPLDGKPYGIPTAGDEVTYHVKKQGQDRVVPLYVNVQLHADNWAPGGVIRIEGFVRTIDGTRGVIGYYKTDSTLPELGALEIQDV